MLILITVILFVLTYVFLNIARNRKSDTYYFYTGVCSFVGVCCVIAICILTYDIATSHTIDEKIAMHQEENANIEANINMLVKEYMDFESDLYSELKSESFITLVSLYPELKSDDLVQKQIQLYTNNNSTIKSLKEQKINISKYKFLVYFGW